MLYCKQQLCSPRYRLRVPGDHRGYHPISMMTSSNGNIFRVTGFLCGGFTGPGESPSQRPVTRNFKFSLICAWRNMWENNREAGDLRRNQTHCDVGEMGIFQQSHYQLFLCNFTKYSDQIKQRNALINLRNIPARFHLLCTLLCYRIKYVFRIVSSIASYITCIGPRQ